LRPHLSLRFFLIAHYHFRFPSLHYSFYGMLTTNLSLFPSALPILWSPPSLP
jgi:hypothetical protein